MAKDDDGDWKSCVKAILSASQTPYSNSNIPSLVALITKRYELNWQRCLLFCLYIQHSGVVSVKPVVSSIPVHLGLP